MKKLFKVLGALAIVLMLGACPVDDENDDVDNPFDIDYTSYNANAGILVRNYTNQKLVAFKGNLDESYILGGIPANAQNHALKKDPLLFDKTEGFPLILITEEQYEANKDNLQTLESAPFTRVYVFFNKNGDNNVVYSISDKLGGEYKLRIQNTSPYDVELRDGGINGPTIGYAVKGIVVTELRVAHGNLNVFPVFQRYNGFRDTLDTMIPYGAADAQGNNFPWFQPLVFNEQNNDQTFNVSEALASITEQKLGVAWLSVNNQTTGAVHVKMGNTVLTTASGESYFSASSNKVIQVNMPSVGSGDKLRYADAITLNTYAVGPEAFEAAIETTDGQTTFELETDKMYVVTVTGNVNQRNIKAVIDLEQAVPINFDNPQS